MVALASRSRKSILSTSLHDQKKNLFLKLFLIQVYYCVCSMVSNGKLKRLMDCEAFDYGFIINRCILRARKVFAEFLNGIMFRFYLSICL